MSNIQIEEMKLRCEVAKEIYTSIISNDEGWKLSQIEDLSIRASDKIVDNAIRKTWCEKEV